VKITLDTNCIIDLERNRPAAASLRTLIDASRRGQVELAVAAISASEKMQSGDYLTNFSEFEERLEQVGLSDARIMEPIGIYGVAFYGHFLYSDNSMVKLMQEIHQILFPSIPFDHEAYRLSRNLPPGNLDPHWRNAICDDLALWCHIYYGRDAFLTSDANFHKQSKKPKLVAIGAMEILRPEELARRMPT
jgi:hypothetical protein